MNVLAPGDRAALIVDFLYRDVGHEAVGGGAVPMLLFGLEGDRVIGTDRFDWPAATLTEAGAFGDVDRLLRIEGTTFRDTRTNV